MIRISTGVTDNGAGLAFQGSELTFMVGIIAASISMMAVVIFACAKSSVKRKGKNPYSGSGKTSDKTVVGESKGQKTPQTSATIRAIGVDTISNSTNNNLAAATFVDIPAMEDVFNNTDDGKDNNQGHGSDTTNTGADKNIIGGGSGGHTNSSGDNNYMGGGHTHVSTEITTCGGGVWS
ncbi:hypothetical protein A4A49_04388 [Nicotiana attenuata]|uniref:Uncharacterized protein n=1 Tax=Nicotiana attenuata TaxID=49451 RepID=A0A314L3G9_NICAT|nr:hypothetical protein A4A49_04388 [Nicotiana attenuata]